MTIPFRPHLVLALLALLSGCAGLQSQEAASFDDLAAQPDPLAHGVKAGERALEQGRYEEALKEFQRVLGREPEHERARLGLAEAYLGLGAPAPAKALFEELREVPQMRLQAMQGIALAQLARGEVDASRTMLTQVTAEDPKLWRAWNALGRSSDLREDWDEAGHAYRKALETTPKPSIVHNNMGMSLMAQGRYEEAGEAFAKALELDPSLDVARTNLRLSLAYQGRYAEALAGVEQDELAIALNNVGYVALLRDDLARAEAYFLRALETSAAYYPPAARNLALVGSMKQIEASAPAS